MLLALWRPLTETTMNELDARRMADFLVGRTEVSKIEIIRPRVGLFARGQLNITLRSDEVPTLAIAHQKVYNTSTELMRVFLPDAFLLG
jgi:hypothetical protein